MFIMTYAARVEEEVRTNRIDLILLGGDITYSSTYEGDPASAAVNDRFYRAFEPIAGMHVCMRVRNF